MNASPRYRYLIRSSLALWLAILFLTALWFGMDAAGVSTEWVSASVFQPLYYVSLFLVALLLLTQIGTPLFHSVPRRYRVWLQEAFVPIFFAVLTLYHYGHLFLGAFPSTYDHTTHLLRAFLTAHALFSEGTLLPWSSAIGAGVPLNDLYPPGYTLLTIGIHVLSLFQLSLFTAYTLSVFAAWWILIGGMYAAARVWFGRTAGGIAVAMIYFDPGIIGLSGWQECFSVGMGSMTLSNGFWLWSMLLFSRCLCHEDSRLLRVCLALCVTAAVLSHTIAFISLPISFLVFSLIHRWWNVDNNQPMRWDGWLWAGVGYGISAWWWLPFMASRAWMLPFGVEVQPAASLAQQIWQGSFLTHTPPLFSLFAAAGSFWGLSRRRQTAPAVMAVLFWLFILVNQNSFERWLFSPIWTDFIQQIPIFRFMVYSKLCGFILAGAMLQGALHTLFSALRRFQKDYFTLFPAHTPIAYALSTRLLLWLAACCCLLPVFAVITDLQNTYIRQYTQSNAYPVATVEHYPPYVEGMNTLLQDLPAPAPDSKHNPEFLLPFCLHRIGIQTNLYESAIPILYGYGIIPPGYMPSMLLNTRAMHFEPQLPTYGTSRYSLVHGAFYNTLAQVSPARVLGEAADVFLLGHKRYQDRFPINRVVPAAGPVEVTEQAYGYVKINITDTPQPANLRIGISRYRKWKAYLDGAPLPVVEHIGAGESFDVGKYITLKAGEGVLELRYELERVDWAAFLLSGFSLVCLGVFVFMPVSIFHKIHAAILSLSRWLIPFGAVLGAFLIFCSLVVLWIVQPVPTTRFWYAGYKADGVGTLEAPPDGELDVEFGLLLGDGCIGRTLEAITLKEILPPPLAPSVNQWSTRTAPVWKIAVQALDPPDEQTPPGKSGLPLTVSQPLRLRLFAGNPYHNWFGINLGHYIPSQSQIECSLHFTDGSQYTLHSRLKPQGHK